MKKIVLILFSLLFVLDGFLHIIGWPFGFGLTWYSWVKMIIGIIGLWIAFMDKK